MIAPSGTVTRCCGECSLPIFEKSTNGQPDENPQNMMRHMVRYACSLRGRQNSEPVRGSAAKRPRGAARTVRSVTRDARCRLRRCSSDAAEKSAEAAVAAIDTPLLTTSRYKH